MRRLKRIARWLGVLVALGVVAFFVIRNYVIRAVIVQQIQKQYGGRVELGDWWLNGTSAGVTGVALGETSQPDSPAWIKVDRISTDISLGGLLQGRYLPTKVVVDHPQLTLRFDKNGKLATPIPIKASKGSKGKGGGKAIPIPEVVVDHAALSVAQAGRPPLTIASAHARLFGEAGQEKIEATTDDPVWGHATITGQLKPTFSAGSITLATEPNFAVDTEEVKKVPFIPAEVWENVAAKGPVDGTVKITFDQNATPPVHVLTRLKLNGVWAKLVPLQVETTETTGQIVIDDAKVEVNHIRGKAIDGTIRAAGLLDFSQNPPDLNVDLRLKGINVEKTPDAWQLDELGATGTMTGRVDLRVRLGADRIDLTGTSGNALIEDGSFQGIPIKELSVNLTATGGDLQFETTQGKTIDKAALEAAPTIPTPRPLPPMKVASDKSPRKPLSAGAQSVDDLLKPILPVLSLARIMSGDTGFLGWATFAVSEVIESQTNTSTTPGTSKLRLPKTITTNIELEDVDLKTILAKAEKFGIKIKFPISGRLTVKATATIPLATLRDLRAYVIHGDASLSEASIDYVDVGEVAAHLDVENGVVNLSDFRGVLINSPEDDIDHLPQKVAIPTRDGELPIGGFRGDLRAEIEPRGNLTARFRGEQLPLGELFAPFLPVPTPLSGDLTLHTRASVNLASLTNPLAYQVEGDMESHAVNYKGATLDLVSTRFGVKEGRATISEFSALMAGRPMSADVGLNLSPPFAFNLKGNVGGWQIANILGFVPNLPPHPAIDGKIDANLDASGTVFPFSIQTLGGARVAAIKIGTFLSRYIVFEWRTEQGVVLLNGLEAAVFGGKITGDARIPTKLGKNLDVNIVLKGIDTQKMTATLPSKGLAITGIADGRVKLTMPLDISTVDAEINLGAPNLSFRPENRYGEGIRVQTLQINARAHDRLISYDATADSLGAKLSFTGSMPIELEPDSRAVTARRGAKSLAFASATPGAAWGCSGGIAELDGIGVVRRQPPRDRRAPSNSGSHGLFELLIELRYGSKIGNRSGSTGRGGCLADNLEDRERMEGTLCSAASTSGDAPRECSEVWVALGALDVRVQGQPGLGPQAPGNRPVARQGGVGLRHASRFTGRLDETLQA